MLFFSNKKYEKTYNKMEIKKNWNFLLTIIILFDILNGHIAKKSLILQGILEKNKKIKKSVDF